MPVKSIALLTIALWLLMATLADCARAQYGSATYAGGTRSNSTFSGPYSVGVPSGTVLYSYGGVIGAGPSETANCSGTVTATFPWGGTGAIPIDVVVEQSASAFWNGYAGTTGSSNNRTCHWPQSRSSAGRFRPVTAR